MQKENIVKREFFISAEAMDGFKNKNMEALPFVRSVALMSDIAATLKGQGMIFEPTPDSLFCSEKPVNPHGYCFDDNRMAHVYWQDLSSPQPTIQDVPTNEQKS